MDNLISVLILIYFAHGMPIESEHPMSHKACMGGAEAISRAIKGPRKDRPIVEMINGTKVPLISAACVPGCMPQDDEPLKLLRDAEAI